MRYSIIRILNQDGRPVVGAKVTIFKEGILGGRILEAKTSNDGAVEWTTNLDKHDKVSIHVNGKIVGKAIPVRAEFRFILE